LLSEVSKEGLRAFRAIGIIEAESARPHEKKATLCALKLFMVLWVQQTPELFDLSRRVFGNNGAEFVGVIPILEAVKVIHEKFGYSPTLVTL
jgi:hypothetical protein